MTQTALALLIFLFPLAYSPGPGNMVFATAGARFGARARWPASLGYHLATWLVAAALGFGLLEVLDTVPGLFAVLKVAGAVYLLWLAIGLFRAGPGAAQITARPLSFPDGVLLLLLNPKAYLIIGLMFSQFLPPGTSDHMGLVLMIITIFTLNNLIAFTIWTMLGAQLGMVLARACAARAMNRGFGLILGGVAIWMLLR